LLPSPRRHRSAPTLGLLLALALLCAPCRAAAPPVLEVAAEGECPDANGLASALRAHGCVMGASEWHASVRRGSGMAELALRNSAGQTVLEREIPGDDCDAIAEAAALIIEAYFVQIGVLPEPRAGDAGPPEAAQPSAAETPPPTSAPDAPQPVATPRVPDARPSSRPVPATAPSQTGRAGADVRQSRADALRWHAIAAVGPRVQAPEIEFAGGAELGVGFDLAALPLSAEVRIATGLPVVVLAPPNRVRRWPSSALGRLGWRLGSVPVTVPWVGAGISAVGLRALDPTLRGNTSDTVWSALAGLGVDAWWPLGRTWFALTGVGCSVYASRERYRIDGNGVGRGPRVECGATLGAGLGSGIASEQAVDSADRRAPLESP
jgi:hypothetical protein